MNQLEMLRRILEEYSEMNLIGRNYDYDEMDDDKVVESEFYNFVMQNILNIQANTVDVVSIFQRVIEERLKEVEANADNTDCFDNGRIYELKNTLKTIGFILKGTSEEEEDECE